MFNIKFKELECEYKFLIDEDLYHKIDGDFDWQQEYEQTNYYFLDRGYNLKDNNITVRVRYRNGLYKLQIKKPSKAYGSLSEKFEYETDLQYLPNRIPGKEISKICGLDISDLYCIGTLTTLRKTCELQPNAKICLDLSRYFDVEDYELEVEVKGEANICCLLDKYSLNRRLDVSKGKFTRFLEKCDFREVFGNE